MSLRRPSLAIAAIAFAAFLTACGPKPGGGEGASTEPGGEGAREAVDEDKLSSTEKEAKSITDENHEMRREIFKLKNQLGIPVENTSTDK